jgi:serine/threonine protein kinase
VVANDFGEALVIDFGSSLDLDGTEPTTLNEIGTYRWMAPELINPGSKEEDENDRERLYFATDIWACAMTILEVHTLGIFFLLSERFITCASHFDVYIDFHGQNSVPLYPPR